MKTIAHRRTGPYDSLYAASPGNILWGGEPGRLVARIADFCPPGRVLDAGCGDGKNALFLERYGCSIVGVDISSLALAGLRARLIHAKHQPTGRYFEADLRQASSLGQLGEFDVLVSYGLFHCIRSSRRVAVHRSLQRHVVPGGTMIFSALIDALPLPVEHQTPAVRLTAEAELEALLDGWEVVEAQSGTISESHLPLVGRHQHAAVWVVARKIGQCR